MNLGISMIVAIGLFEGLSGLIAVPVGITQSFVSFGIYGMKLVGILSMCMVRVFSTLKELRELGMNIIYKGKR